MFSRTQGKISSNSEAASRNEAVVSNADLLDPDTGRRPGPITRARRASGDFGNAVLDNIIYGKRAQTANRDVGMMLSKQGGDAQSLAEKLLKEYLFRQNAAKGMPLAEGLLQYGIRGGAAASTAGPR